MVLAPATRHGSKLRGQDENLGFVVSFRCIAGLTVRDQAVSIGGPRLFVEQINVAVAARRCSEELIADIDEIVSQRRDHQRPSPRP